MSPEQELYDWVFSKCLEITNSVYDYLPPENESVEYPFIYVGNVDTIARANSSSRGGDYTITVDVWGKRDQRIDVAEMAEKLYQLANGWCQTNSYTFYAFPGSQSKRIMQDTSVPNTIFNRGNLDLKFRLD